MVITVLTYLEKKKTLVNSHIEKFLPEMVDEAWLKQAFGRTEMTPEFFTELARPINDLLSRGGKRWRPVLMLLCCDAVKGGSKILDLLIVNNTKANSVKQVQAGL